MRNSSQTISGTDAGVGQLPADIVETRHELGDTVGALADKADVPARAKDTALRTTAKVREQAKSAASQVNGSVQRQPARWAGAATVVAAVVAATVGVVMWRRNRRTTPQRRAVQAWNAVTDRLSR